MRERGTTTLGAILDSYGGEVKTGPFGTALKASEYSSTGVPVISVGEIGHGEFRIHDRTPYVGTNVTSRLPEYLLLLDDIVFARKGSIDRSAIVRREQVGWFLGSDGIRLRMPKEVCAKYTRYWISGQPVRDWLIQNSTGSTMASLNQATIRRIPIVLPPLAEQREIAAILGALDDKIEVNRKVSSTLEEMARALYRSWFVDFDPVWARLERRQPAHMDAATAALFPDSFDDDDGLPMGWCLTPMSEVSGQMKQSVKPRDTPEAAFWHYSLPAFDAGAAPILENGAAIKSNKLFVPNDAVLFSRLNPSTPRVWWARADMASATPAASTEFYVATASCLEETPWLYCMLSSPEFLEQARSRVTGTSNSHQRVPPSALAEIEVIEPTQSVKVAFGEMTSSWFEKIHAAKAESRTLAILRDTLLPRLMSGELRVGEARELVEEVA